MVDPRFDYQAALAGCAQGDADALQQLYTHEAPCMLALANVMLGDQAAAQDAVHDAFVLIWKNASAYDSSMGSARAWLHSILRYRTRGLLQRRPAPASVSPAPASLPFSNHANDLAGMLARQPENLRKPLLMAYYSGLGYAAIAKQLGRPAAEVRHSVRSCLRTLREFEPA
ncbi:MAG TPA: sigma factor [Pusillimonas sp.]|uniref:sigma factor n=1 Tax=Pusillimonas sp. TaxID=3040095 RepID=UPI002C0A6E3A|nr:sigma factor [Pusillimonas sp.]HUH88571.1 sigma factor [Pusillimonas sp.]